MKCLMHKPGLLRGRIPGVRTRFEDFLSLHQIMTPMVHFNGVFLPWHRLYLHEMERVLQQECHYRGALP
jgi:tyrosinase